MQPEHGWTCFHCGETFTNHYQARQHFGDTPDKEPACQMGATREDRAVLRRLRAAEITIDRLRVDIENDTSSTQAFYSKLEAQLQSYKPFRGCRSIQDVFNVYDSMEGRALAAEELLAKKK
jgi:hypothetical protein